MMCVEGSFEGNDDKAVVILEKTPFSQATAEAILTGILHALITKFLSLPC